MASRAWNSTRQGKCETGSKVVSDSVTQCDSARLLPVLPVTSHWKCGREPFSTPGELEVKAAIFQNHKLYWEWILVLPGQSTKFLMLICHASLWLGKCNCLTIASRLLRDGGTMRLGSQLERWMSCYPKRKRPAHFPIAHGTFCAWTPVSHGKQAKHLHQVGQIKMIKIT